MDPAYPHFHSHSPVSQASFSPNRSGFIGSSSSPSQSQYFRPSASSPTRTVSTVSNHKSAHKNVSVDSRLSLINLDPPLTRLQSHTLNGPVRELTLTEPKTLAIAHRKNSEGLVPISKSHAHRQSPPLHTPDERPVAPSSNVIPSATLARIRTFFERKPTTTVTATPEPTLRLEEFTTIMFEELNNHADKLGLSDWHGSVRCVSFPYAYNC